jgi:Bor protein
MESQLWGRAATVALICLGLTSCYKATFIRDAQAVSGEEHDKWTTFFIYGLVGTEEVEVKDFCPSGDAAVIRTGGNFATGFVSAITLGIYTPRKVYVTCAADGKTARRLELDVDSVGRPVHARLITDTTSHVLEVNATGERQWRMSTTEGEQS